ncbi:MAG: PIN domain-containing protein [Verrucomicrobia bacterium]|nr:PIN domain-containing protein [Verrucomicrobiota bacterium]
MIAVLDTSVVLAGLFFRTDSYRCLVAFARRQYQMAGTHELFEEYRE